MLKSKMERMYDFHLEKKFNKLFFNMQEKPSSRFSKVPFLKSIFGPFCMSVIQEMKKSIRVFLFGKILT